MSAFSATSIPRPKDWQDFERKSRVLFECLLNDPNTQTHGRGGQSQDGVDIFGRRDGAGRLVGVQCKGKERGYGRKIAEAELRQEVRKTERFEPPLDEFILVTTAPDDKVIQEAARKLEQEVRSAGRALSISVWGWETIEQRVSLHRPALKAFHPDYTPISDDLLNADALIIESGREQSAKLDYLIALVESRQVVQTASSDAAQSNSIFDGEIDEYRNLRLSGKSRTAIKLICGMKNRVWNQASDQIRFRLLTNLGACHHDLGEYTEAANLFMEAYDYSPDNHIAIANRIAALLILGDRERSLIAAHEASNLFPESMEVALQRLQARAPEETLDEAWNALSGGVRDHPEVVSLRVMILRECKNTAWRQSAVDARVRYPSNDTIRRLAAEAILDELMDHDPSLLGSRSPYDKGRLEEAAAILSEIWEQSTQSETSPDAVAAHNASIAYMAIGDATRAIAIADDAIARGVALEPTKNLRIERYVDDGNIGGAITLANTLPKSSRRDIGLAELFAKTDPERARTLVQPIRDTLDDELLEIGASNVIVESYLAQWNYRDAEKEAQQLSLMLPNHPSGLLLLYRVRRAQEHEDSHVPLLEALDRLSPQTDFASRFLLARELDRCEYHDEAADVLDGYVDETRNSAALRTYLSAAFNADRRATIARILGNLPEFIVSDLFFLRLQVALAIRVGNLASAEATARKFLSVRPGDLEMHLQLLHLLARQDREAELKKELARPPNEFEGSSEENLHLAFFLHAYGYPESAYRLAYKTWLNNQHDPATNLRYVGVLLRSEQSQDMPATLDRVSVDSAFELVSGNEKQKFIIEPDAALRILPNAIAADHPLAIAAIGKRVGEVVETGRGGTWSIESIKRKEVDALHHILSTFNIYFPTADGLDRISITSKESGPSAEMAQTLRARREAINRVFDMYQRTLLPLRVVARSLGSRAVDTLVGLIEDSRIVRVCHGRREERDAAFAAIEMNGMKGCVVDSVTFHIIRRLELATVVEAVCGPIGLVEQTLKELRDRRDEVKFRLNEPSLSLYWENGQVFRSC